MSSRQKFIASANRGKILAKKCVKCGHVMLATFYYCQVCSSNTFKSLELEGTGIVVTFTIQTVAPEGFEDVGSYAWVVFKLDSADFRVSGFLDKITSAKDLTIGTRVKVSAYDPKHGLRLQKL